LLGMGRAPRAPRWVWLLPRLLAMVHRVQPRYSWRQCSDHATRAAAHNNNDNNDNQQFHLRRGSQTQPTTHPPTHPLSPFSLLIMLSNALFSFPMLPSHLQVPIMFSLLHFAHHLTQIHRHSLTGMSSLILVGSRRIRMRSARLSLSPRMLAGIFMFRFTFIVSSLCRLPS
jgi:hypothetical protein